MLAFAGEQQEDEDVCCVLEMLVTPQDATAKLKHPLPPPKFQQFPKQKPPWNKPLRFCIASIYLHCGQK